MSFRKIVLLPLLMGGVLILTACHSFLSASHDGNRNNEPEYQEGIIQDVQYNVHVGHDKGAGQLASGGIGESHRPNRTAQVVGSVGGVAISRELFTGDSQLATLYLVKLDSGKLRSVIEGPDADLLCVGDRVYFEEGAQNPVLTLDEAYYEEGHHVRTGCLKTNDNDDEEDEDITK